jgi:hypothetical protein
MKNQLQIPASQGGYIIVGSQETIESFGSAKKILITKYVTGFVVFKKNISRENCQLGGKHFAAPADVKAALRKMQAQLCTWVLRIEKPDKFFFPSGFYL